MKITIESTSKIVELNGVPARVWEGETSKGVKIHCFITRIAIDKNELNVKEFEAELLEQKVPSTEIQSFPLRMII